MNFFSAFAGIGGFDLGLERAGWRCVGQCEIDQFCNAVLEKHWPNVWRWQDVKTLTGELIRQHCGRVDALVGGPPCQSASVAGQRRGAADDRWLWPDFLRLVSEVKPVWVLAENPRGITSLDVEGLQFSEWLAREFAARGYELSPVELAAEDVGAPHRRERVWFVAYRNGGRQLQPQGRVGHERRRIQNGCGDGLAITASDGWREGRAESARIEGRFDAAVCDSHVADAACGLLDGGGASRARWRSESSDRHRGNQASELAHAEYDRREGWQSDYSNRVKNGTARPPSQKPWLARPGEPQHEWEEPRVIAERRTAFSVSLLNADSRAGRGLNGLVAKARATFKSALGLAAHGLSRDVARWRNAALKACGNAVVPQCAEVIGRMINRFEKERA